jgi:citrate lyase subunit beta/citryl-CoA lyase
VIPLIETARGIELAPALAKMAPVVRLAFGALDFQVDLGIEGDDDALLYFRSRLVLASRLAEKSSPIDGIRPSIDDVEALRHDTLRARRLGFGARLCIHPRQVEPIHEVLAPTMEARTWASRVVTAMAAFEGGAVAVDGKMVDRPIHLRAHAIWACPEAKQRLRG